MSSDLFAEFGDSSHTQDYEPKASKLSYPKFTQGGHAELDLLNQSHGGGNPWLEDTTPNLSRNGVVDDVDDFGDFEVASPGLPIGQNGKAKLIQDGRESAHQTRYDPSPISTQAISSQNLDRTPRPIQQPSSVRNANVLFDVEDPNEALWEEAGEKEAEDDVDEFGDFEDANVTDPKSEPSSAIPMQRTSQPTMDLLSLEPEPTHEQARNDSTNAKPAHTHRKPAAATLIRSEPQTRPSQQQQSLAVDESWDDFDAVSTPVTPAQVDTESSRHDHAVTIPSHLVSTMDQPTPSGRSPVTPTNVPPPSVLLTLFPPLFTRTSSDFLQPLSSLPQSERITHLLSSSAISFFNAYATTVTVFAHILAGRRQRWKRDKRLAQSMSIGPSVSGRSGGMKLTGVDKSEAGREDREAVDALRVWKAHVGRLRSVVSAFNAAAAVVISQKPHPDGSMKLLQQVPELAETMPVRTARTAEGAVVSLQACALCGLKREERVAKVDIDVEDSFGEWWIEGTNMHLSCWNFWEGNNDSLRSR